MVVAGIAAMFMLAGAPSEAVPRLVDGPLTNYYSRALSAASSEPQKSLAMLELLLIPSGTEVVPDYSPLPAEARGDFARGVERGFRMWQEQLGADFPLKLVLQATTSTAIKLSFVDALNDSPTDHKGEIRTTRKIQWNRTVHFGTFEAAIDIVKWGSKGALMSENDIAHVVAHEIGHALGLGDANDLQHIMGPILVGNAFARLAPDEVDAVRSFRRMLKAQIERVQLRAGK